MILVLLITPVYALIMLLLDILPPIGAFPTQFVDSFNHVLDVIFSHLDWLGMFIRIDTIKTLVPLTLFVINFEYVYRFFMWVIKKIPFINIS